jgi:hypothetical protein
MSNETKQTENYWVIGTNKWSVVNYTKEEAEMYFRTLINCENCIDCIGCHGCSNCIGCHGCSNCRDCRDCRDCHGCSNCIDCHGCSNCRDCRDCRDCHGCSNCIDCIDCRYCLGFKTNPERITSPKLGSRNSQTTFYWNDQHEQIVCGCFKGTLLEFEEKIKETHGDNEFAQGYFKWIDAVKFYKLTYGGNK